jgi:hypothetical protein
VYPRPISGDQRDRVALGHFGEQVEEQSQRQGRHRDGLGLLAVIDELDADTLSPAELASSQLTAGVDCSKSPAPSKVSATDYCDFVAEDIGAFSVANTVFALTANESNDALSVGSTGDVMMVEVA